MLSHSIEYPALPSSLLLLLLLLAAVLDVRGRKIPNALNAALWSAGLLAQGLVHGIAAVPSALCAGVLVVALLWLPWLKGVLGAGDVKLAAGAAVWLGFSGLPTFLLATGLCGGLVAAAAYAASLKQARAEMRQNMLAVVVLRTPPAVSKGANGHGRVSVPYGVSVALGGAFTLFLPMLPLG
jgi:prepilin peptidase CpaA